MMNDRWGASRKRRTALLCSTKRLATPSLSIDYPTLPHPTEGKLQKKGEWWKTALPNHVRCNDDGERIFGLLTRRVAFKQEHTRVPFSNPPISHTGILLLLFIFTFSGSKRLLASSWVVFIIVRLYFGIKNGIAAGKPLGKWNKWCARSAVGREEIMCAIDPRSWWVMMSPTLIPLK